MFCSTPKRSQKASSFEPLGTGVRGIPPEPQEQFDASSLEFGTSAAQARYRALEMAVPISWGSCLGCPCNEIPTTLGPVLGPHEFWNFSKLSEADVEPDEGPFKEDSDLSQAAFQIPDRFPSGIIFS